MNPQQQAPAQPPPQAILFEHVFAFLRSRIVQIFAECNVADDIAHGRQPAVQDRFLRAAASVGLVERTGDKYTLTPLGEALRTDVPGSAHGFIACVMGGGHYQAWGAGAITARTGQVAFPHALGTDIWDYFTKVNPAEGHLFNQAMMGFTVGIANELTSHYDLPESGVWIDIGGGIGTLLSFILKARPNLRGIVADLPFTAPDAAQFLAEQGITERCRFEGINFFESVPPAGDVYSMKHILHDWNDEKASAILQTVRAAMPDQGKLVLIEAVVPENDAEAGPARLMDMHMAVLCNGKERTEPEWRELLAANGFRIDRIVPLPTIVSVIEATRL